MTGLKMTIVAKNDHIKIERLQLGPFGTNSYRLVPSSRNALR